jgi:protein subunit release factor A
MSKDRTGKEKVNITTKKDFKLDWFSGTGAGGQRRNKKMCCCRLTHIPSGITVTAQNQRDRPSNQNDAFKRIVPMIMSYYHPEVQKARFNATETIRTYHQPDNRVKDHASGLMLTYKEVVTDGDMSEMIEARMKSRQEELLLNDLCDGA